MEGAQTNLHCTLCPDLKTGYYVDCKETPAKLPIDHEKKANRLWILSEEAVGYKCKSL